MTMTALPGDPDALGTVASRYTRVAASILEISSQLDALADELAGSRAVDALAVRTRGAAERVASVHPRYQTTAAALTSYAVQLRDAQQAANSAIGAAATASASIPYYRDRSRELIPQPRVFVPDEEREERRVELAIVEARLDELEQDLAQARAAYERAVDYRDAAARAAIEAIRPVLESMNDTVGDYVDAWVQSLPDFLQAIGRWVGDVFVTVVGVLQEVVAELVAAVTYLLLVIILIPDILANYPPELWAIAFFAPGLLLPLIGALTGFLAVRLAREPLRPTPVMTPSEPVDSSSAPGSRHADTMTTNMMLDGAGGTDSTVIEIVEVLDEEGDRIGWRVILPSTQDWQELSGQFGGAGPEGDQGAMNDLDSNLALTLTPSQQAAYERAVVQAMLAAGIGPDDPVMLSGWSQGGILAGVLASDRNSPFNIQAIFVSGAPIDAMDIPDSVSVVSVQHTGEPVAILDGPVSAPAQQGPNWATITAPPPLIPGSQQQYEPHNAEAYIVSAQLLVDESTDPRVQAITQRQEMFFSDNEVVTLYDGAEQPVPL